MNELTIDERLEVEAAVVARTMFYDNRRLEAMKRGQDGKGGVDDADYHLALLRSAFKKIHDNG